MAAKIKDLIERGGKLFSDRGSLLTYWQEVADHFYPERADFTVTRNIGDDFAGHLTSSRPLLMSRDLGNALSAMLRPRDQEWFKLTVEDDEDLGDDSKKWLESATGVMRRAMYDRNAGLNFVRATKEGDRDYANFGNAVISVEPVMSEARMLYRNWHLRDCAWAEDKFGRVNEMHRNWQPTARELQSLFGDPRDKDGKAAEGRYGIHQKVKDLLNRNTPFSKVKCRHVMMPFDDYGMAWAKGKDKPPFVSIHLDIDNEHCMAETPIWYNMYAVPRWHKVSGSAYAYSLATVAALPDARLLQSITLTLLEAGEKYVDPPLIATHEAIRGDVALYPGGITWADKEYDEKLGAVLRPLTTDKGGYPIGFELHDRVDTTLREAFYLNTLNLPPMDTGDKMTAYEVRERVQEFIRRSMPLFEPIEDEYNGALCETTFEVLRLGRAFGPPQNVPQEIQGRSTRFVFESPLHRAVERAKAGKFGEFAALLAQAAEMDPETMAHADIPKAWREAVEGIDAPLDWMRSEDDAIAAIEEAREAQTAQGAITEGQGVADIAKTVGEAVA